MRAVRMSLAAGLATLSIGAAAAIAADTLSAEAIAKALGFGAAEQARLQAGEIVTAEIGETTAKQLAAALALKVPASLDDVAATVTEGATLDANPGVLAHGMLDPAQVDAAAFAGITLEAAEVRTLLGISPGSDLNLSRDEIAVFQALAQQYRANDPAAADAVNAAWRQVLAGRLQAYLEHGLDGIAPYDRGGGTSSAADDLRAAAEAATLAQQAVPDLLQAFLHYPGQSVPDVDHLFFWTKQTADDRPVYVLTHRMTQQRPDGPVMLSRDFYASHSFNASQAIAGALPVADGVVVFYANRTSSDQVAGFMSGMRQRIGRGMMRDSLVAAMEQIRKTWQP